jgi:hypothetical protein
MIQSGSRYRYLCGRSFPFSFHEMFVGTGCVLSSLKFLSRHSNLRVVRSAETA